MDAWYLAVRSVLVLLAFVSDDFLLLDLWIVTPPGSSPHARSSARGQWMKRGLAVFKTACMYAVLEPLWFALVNGLSMKWMLWFSLFSAYVHIHAIQVAIALAVMALEKEVEKHKKFCLPAAAQGDREPAVASEAEDTGDTAELLELEEARVEGSAQPAQQGAPSNPASGQARCKHDTPLLFTLAPLLPVITAAATNVGLLQYTAYLHSEDSGGWYDRFAFGWTVVGLLEIFVVGASKWANSLIVKLCNRHVLAVDAQHWQRDLALRVSSFAALLAVRSLGRLVLAHQTSFTSITITRDGLALSNASLASFRLPQNSTASVETQGLGEGEQQTGENGGGFSSWFAFLGPIVLVAQVALAWYQRRRQNNASRPD